MTHPIQSDEYLSLGEVVPYMSRAMGINRTRQTVHNWAIKGVERGLGRIVRLRITKRAGRMYTTRNWLRKFLDEISMSG